jgi:hypothetical protein
VKNRIASLLASRRPTAAAGRASAGAFDGTSTSATKGEGESYVRSDAEAMNVGTTQRQAVGTGLTLLVLMLATLWVSPAPALAATVTERPLLFKFDGSDTTEGAFAGATSVAVDEATGTVYVVDNQRRVINKFNADGEAVPFSSTGSSSLDGTASPFGRFGAAHVDSASVVSVDNSGGPTQGRIYVNAGNLGVLAFDPSGAYLWQIPRAHLTLAVQGSAMDSAGHLWVSEFTTNQVSQFDNTGSPDRISTVPITSSRPRRIALDAAGNLYVDKQTAGIDKYVNGSRDSTLDSAVTWDVWSDQSSPAGHIFTLRPGNFAEFDASGTQLGTFDGLKTIGGGRGIAHNSALDRVYVADFPAAVPPVVEAFGPVVTGSAPEATIEPTTEIGISSAHFSGTAQPLELNNNYYFEWKPGTAAHWTAAKSSPVQSVPADGGEHPVSFSATGLAGGVTHQVRLVAENADNRLRTASSPHTFTTEKPPPPVVSIDPPSSVTATTAQIDGSVDPGGDAATTWRLELSTDPNCASGFTQRPVHQLESEATSPVTVSEELKGLLPSQHYCVRIRAVNGGGTATSGVEEFTTAPTVPTAVETLPAAPRTATSGRLNARLNPEGETFVYRFEYSSDGGSTWTTLEDGVDTSEARSPIVVSHEFVDLSPESTYSYRFTAENPAGVVQGGERSFTTRSRSEGARHPRGLELVNNPDKGNQNVAELGGDLELTYDRIAEGGEHFGWGVAGGAPGSNTGSLDTFLASRTSVGWDSKSLVPTPDVQFGEGTAYYRLTAAAKDLSRFVFMASEGVISGASATFVRTDRQNNQEVLVTINESNPEAAPSYWDVSDDLRHALFVDQGHLYDYEAGGKRVEVGLMPSGGPPACGIPRPGFRSGPSHPWIATGDASRVYFRTSGDVCSAPLGLYVRNRQAGTTTLLAAQAEFLRASPDGREAIFSSPMQLAPEDEDFGNDIYRWDEETASIECLTCAVPGADVGDVEPSEGLSRVYFTSQKQLLPDRGTPGAMNLYLWHAGTIRFVASVGAFAQSGLGDRRHFRLTPDGRVLGIRSDRPLTSDDPGMCPNVQGVLFPCLQLYRYDDDDGSLECVSCKRQGATPHMTGAEFYLSRDGKTVAFTTSAPLVPGDVNGRTDVYEWYEGARRLVTDGVTKWSTVPRLSGMGNSGRDVFFTIASPTPLTGFEQDGLTNLYDARVGGGFTAPAAPGHCVEDSCQGPLQAAPALTNPGSATYAGLGNLPSRSHCGALDRRAQRMVRRAKRLGARAARLSRRARGSGRHSTARRLARNAQRLGRVSDRLERRAKRLSRNAQRCRQSSRRAGK